MGNIEHKKKYKVERKVIKSDDIIRIAQFVHGQAKDDDYEESYEIAFDDDSEISNRGGTDIFASDEFTHRRAKKITIRYASKGYGKRIYINLYNSVLSSLDCEIEITSKDKEWYNSTCNQIKTIIDEIEPQKFCLSQSAKAIISGALGIIEALMLAYTLNNPGDASRAFFISVYTLFFASINAWFLDGLSIAYPNIEFSFGPSYLNKSRKIRRALGILIPFLIDLVLFFLGR